jgi:hypothetical protein
VNIKLESGDASPFFTAGRNRVLTLVGRGPGFYLWVGNDDESNGSCFGHLSGVRLRKLAEVILENVPAPTPRKRAK